ncbi:MAG: TonB-dependent receptor [Vicinamibacteria bacterium]
MRRRGIGLLVFLSVFAALPARADVTRFELSGTVTDTTGALLPGATVTIRNMDTGLTQTATTDEQGGYRFAPLDPKGRWSLTAELQGFKSERQEGLAFKANTQPRIDFRLDLGSVEETITVTAQSPVVETRTSDLKQTVGDEQVANLPNNGRDFLSFVELSGSAVRVGGGSGNVSINGQGIRSADFISDGTSITGREIRTLNGEFGGGNGLSLDTIEEVQVISNGFKAEVGRTGAGTINIITKSGTNDFRGSVYTYQKPSAFVANDLITGNETSIDRQQYGATFGGPIVEDRTHFFVNWESNRIDDESVVTSALDPGTFARPQSNDQLFFKLDHQLDTNNRLDARFNFNINDQEANGVGGLNTYERRSNAEGRTWNVAGSWVSTFGADKVNELRVRFTRDLVDFYSPLISDTGAESRNPDFSRTPTPAITRSGVGNAGPNPGFPQNLDEKRLQVVNHFSLYKGNHDLKFGADVIGSFRFVTFFNNLVGTYSFSAGTPFPFDAANPATFPFQYTQSFGDSDLRFRDAMVSFFAQDDWRVGTSLILNLGVRWDYDSLFFGDTNNFGPRLGFAWDVSETGKTVVRGNFGMFYDTLESSLVNRESNFGPEGQTTIDLRQGDPLFPAFPERFDSLPEGAREVTRATVYIPIFQGDDFPGSIDTVKRTTPYFVNYSLGVERELRPGFGASIDYTHVEGIDLLVTFDANAPPFFPVGPGQTRTLAQADLLRPFGSPNRVPGPYGLDFGGFRSLFLQINDGSTDYHAVKFGLEKYFDGKYGFGVRYTWSRARGDTDNFRLNGSFVPGLVDQEGDRSYQYGPLNTDVPHLFVANAIYQLPWDVRLAGVFLVRSGFPYTGVAGSDADGDGVNSGQFGDRPAGVDRNSFRRPTFKNFDFSIAKEFRFADRHAFEVRLDLFNVFNNENTIQVNTTLGLDPANPRAGFGSRTQVAPQRQAQIALRYTF